MMQIVRPTEFSRDSIFGAAAATPDLSAPVREIIDSVRLEGNQALYRLTERFDGAVLKNLWVTEAEIQEAMAAQPRDFMDVLRTAADNIRMFHVEQRRQSFWLNPREGVTMGQRLLPIARVGLYVPGGTAAYPSSVLMNAIPAQIAGCPEIVIASPPGPDGRIHPAILAAAGVLNITQILKLGGAQAVAALAYGTESIRAVDKIVGPGNAYVAEAKRQVFGQVAIDMMAGPSEILIIADQHSRADWLAADLLSQAEHDALASAVLVTPCETLTKAVKQEVNRQLETLPRREIAARSMLERGRIVLVKDLDEAIRIANLLAPEHLELCVEEPFLWLEQVRCAGSVFLGRWCPEAVGDYLAGCNHTLPTGGTARFASPLSVDDFQRKMQFCYYSKQALEREAPAVARFARQEGLEAHARSAESRLEMQP